MVIGLNLCPFADKVFKADRIRYAISNSRDPKDVLELLSKELTHLAAAPREVCETTLLIAPYFLEDFLDFNDFIGDADEALEDLDLVGTIQLVGFHPKFQFDKTESSALENYTNRSPFPIIHLLREESITEVSNNPEELLEIPRRNTALLRQMGLAQIQERMKSYTS